MFYFAYGSNMNHQQMKKRCPSAKFICRGYIENYKFVYDGYSSFRSGAVANIIETKNSIVWGGLFEIDEKCRKNLGQCEGCPDCYKRKEVEVKTDKNETYKAWVYLREVEDEDKPSEEYRDVVKRGALDCGLPKDYIDENL